MLVLIIFLIFFITSSFIYLAVREQNKEISNSHMFLAVFSAGVGYFLAADYFGFIYNPDDPNNAPMVVISFLIVGITPMLIISYLRGWK